MNCYMFLGTFQMHKLMSVKIMTSQCQQQMNSLAYISYRNVLSHPISSYPNKSFPYYVPILLISLPLLLLGTRLFLSAPYFDEGLFKSLQHSMLARVASDHFANPIIWKSSNL